jgi:hypothetical protein
VQGAGDTMPSGAAAGDVGGLGPTPAARHLTTPRSAGLAGVVFAVLFSVSLVLLRTSMPEDPLSQPDLSDGDVLRLKVALALVPIAGIAFLWFVGVVRDRLGDVEDRFFSTVYLGSGLLFLAMVFVSMALAGAIVVTADADVSRSGRAEIVDFGRAVMLQVTNVYALRMAAVFMISLSTTWHRSGTAPRWLVISTFVVAAFLLVVSSLSVWVALVFPAWVLLVSLYVLVAARRAGPQQP